MGVPADAPAGRHPLRCVVQRSEGDYDILLEAVRAGDPNAPGPPDESTCTKEEFVTRPAVMQVHLINAAFARGYRYAYVKGAAESIIEALGHFGVQFHLISDTEIGYLDLRQFDAIFIGPNAYLTPPHSRRRRFHHEVDGSGGHHARTLDGGEAHRFALGRGRLSIDTLAASGRWSPDVSLVLFLDGLVSGVVAGRSSAPRLPFPLSIRTVVCPRKGPRIWYDDQRRVHEQIFAGDEELDYAFIGTDPSAADNVWLREAAARQVPVVYFLGSRPGAIRRSFQPILVDWDARALRARIAFGEVAGPTATARAPDAVERRYALRLVKQRLTAPDQVASRLPLESSSSSSSSCSAGSHGTISRLPNRL